MSPTVLTLVCGHERWAPVNWNGATEVVCNQCGPGVLRAAVLVDGELLYRRPGTPEEGPT